ncbi:PLP-dependent decarboxylase [Fastidiosibacter lacustris]|uniref:PLP-dependent decarboxylase n=1 Tax=Fastidiosibacter lacustris TaxID=2056695 RepID=UPI000E350DFF|nr:PLP-dependent decarboxylase [Fastidiosibacter lacustris]
MFDLNLHEPYLQSLVQQIDAPFFYYDLDVLASHIKKLSSLPVKLWYALKANPLSCIIQTLATEKMCFDVASIGELEQVLAQGVLSQRILHTGPAKSYVQLMYFIDRGVRVFVIESIQQLVDLTNIVNQKKVDVQVLLRVQLKWALSEKNVLGGKCITPFGLPPQDWVDYFKQNKQRSHYVDIIGFHCFQWGNVLSKDKLEQIWFTISKTLNMLADEININLRVLDLGGGLGVPYTQLQVPLVLKDIEILLKNLINSYPKLQFWLELGRYAVAECGVYLTRVVDRKQIYGKTLLVVEGGSQHLLRPAITGEAFPTTLLRQSFAKLIPIQVHGSLCTNLDQLGQIQLPDDVNINDYLVFHTTGAYGFTESMPFFLCHKLPAEVVFNKGHIRIIRQTKNAQSWLV